MKTIFSIGIVSIASLVLFSFNSTNSATPFEKALREKKIEIEILPTGSHSGNSINLKVKNLTNSKLELQMPYGTVFVPDNEDEQTLITREEEMFALNKNEEKILALNAYCTEASDHCPSKASTFKMAKTPNAKLTNLVSFMDSLKIKDDYMIQQSIWCVTDSESVSNVYSDDLKTSKALRNYLCALTGQKDTWYNTQREIRVNEQHEIVRIPKEIKGQIEFTSTERVELQGMVKDSTGAVIITNPNKTVLPPGKVKFDFKLKIEGWQPGNYTVVYTNNGKEVINQPFSF